MRHTKAIIINRSHERFIPITASGKSDMNIVPLTPSGEPRFFEEEPLVLSDEDRDAFLAALDNPPEPTEALKKLMRGTKKPAG